VNGGPDAFGVEGMAREEGCREEVMSPTQKKLNFIPEEATFGAFHTLLNGPKSITDFVQLTK